MLPIYIFYKTTKYSSETIIWQRYFLKSKLWGNYYRNYHIMKILFCNYYNLPHSPYFLQEGNSSAAARNVGFLFHCFHHAPLLPKALRSRNSPVNVLINMKCAWIRKWFKWPRLGEFMLNGPSLGWNGKEEKAEMIQFTLVER